MCTVIYVFICVFTEAVYCISGCSLSHILSFFSKVLRQCRQTDTKLTLETACTAGITTIIGGNRQLPPFNERKMCLHRRCLISFIFLRHLHKSINEQDVGQEMLQTPVLGTSSLTQNVKNGNSHETVIHIKFLFSSCRQVTQLNILDDKG